MYKLDVLEITDSFDIEKVDTKIIYSVDKGDSLAGWIRFTGGEKIEYPKLSSPFKVKENKQATRMIKDGLGCIFFIGNNVYQNAQSVSILTANFSNPQNSPPIVKENFNKVIMGFAARKLIEGNWVNWYDEYLAPNEEHEQFEQFKYDSLVYSLFESKSNQSSLRQVEYKDKLWDIKNEFFWMSADRMKELADENGYDELYNDARTASDRHVYKLLFGEERIYDKLSDDAKAVLDKATELVERSMELRQVMADDHNHLDSWDAGYAQLKLVWKEYFEEDFKEFRQLYKNMEDRMRPLVYELGFLMK